MQGIFGDVWFYISGAGFVVSMALFVFLLGQYRAAVQSSDHHEPELEPQTASPAPVPVAAPKPVAVVPLSKPAVIEKTLIMPPPAAAPAPAVVPAPMPAPAPAPVPTPVPVKTAAPAARKAETTTGGLSPAVVYLQNIKSQMDNFDKELTQIKAAVAKQSAQGENILKRLSELADQWKAATARGNEPPKPEPSSQTIPVSVPANKAPAPIPVPVSEPEPAPEPVAAQAPPDRTMELKINPPPAVLEQPPQQQETAAEPKPARKGPVWPI